MFQEGSLNAQRTNDLGAYLTDALHSEKTGVGGGGVITVTFGTLSLGLLFGELH